MDNLKDVESFGATYNEGEDLQKFLEKFQVWIERSIFNRISKRVNFLLLRMEEGTAQGQITFWDATLKRWVHTEVGELFWDDVNKRLGVNDPTPANKVDVDGTVRMKRFLAGGVER